MSNTKSSNLPLYYSNYFTPNQKEKPPDQKSEGRQNPHDSLENILNTVLPQQTQENKTVRTRKHLGEIGKMLTDEQIECINAEFLFLIDKWLDEYEKDVFEGKTIKEAINEG